MFKRTRISTGALLALGAIAALPAAAQDAAQRVEITGSNIRRVQSETASPVQTVSREDIARSGKGSVAELLQTLSVDNQGSVPTTFGNGFASGASGISLRGLGSASTLVLINGRRIAPYGLADDGQKVFADLNVIPLEAVERVEIVKDGASAIYGSDAIAGVVNIILRKDFNGVVAKASVGQSQKADGRLTSAAVTAGFGDLQKDKYNILLNLEGSKKDAIWNRDRDGRGAVGRADLRDLGFSANEALGGVGAITLNANGDPTGGGSAINGNVRNPANSFYYNRGNTTAATGFTKTFPGAACANFTSHAQGDPGAGCLIDSAQVYSQIQPSADTVNFFGRGTMLVGANLQAYAELNLYNSKSKSSSTPATVSGNAGYPGGPVLNAAIALGALHPDNPYSAAARVRYLAADVGPRVSNVESDFNRFLVGAKGTFGVWDFDTALLSSETKVTNSRSNYLQRDVTFALLNPTGANSLVAGKTNAQVAAANSAAYAALPAGTFWRIAENAGLNSAAMYAALSPTIANDSSAKTQQIDFKASRELMQLGGGAMSLAVGAEYRRESVSLQPTAGTDRGNIIGLGYSAYDGARNLTAAYAELLAPVTKNLELNAALRVDHYSDVGNSTTPKFGMKWTPTKTVAVRGTYAEGFRAPSAAENGKGGLAAFTVAADPLRCNLGVTTACSAGTVMILTLPNPALVPEKSKSYTLGLVFDPMPGTSISVDYWEIQRKNEINQDSAVAAIAAGKVARDASSPQPGIVGDPGPITAILANYVNSSKTTVKGFDVDARQVFNLGANGKLGFDIKWTHMLNFIRTETDGSSVDYAGTHGNCDVTNCIGTPADRINFGVSYDVAGWRIAAIANYRAAIENRDFKGGDCVSHYANGTEICSVSSFTTLDLTARWSVTPKLEIYGSIQNLLDTKPPLDVYTYGATSYNPLDYSGAIGRYFNIGLKYKF